MRWPSPICAIPACRSTSARMGVGYLLSTRGSGYFPMRVAQAHIDSGELQMVRRAPRFVYPAYAVYPADRDEEAYEPILQGLKQVVATLSLE